MLQLPAGKAVAPAACRMAILDHASLTLHHHTQHTQSHVHPARTCIMQPRPQASTAQGGPAATVLHSMRATSAGLNCGGTIQLACCSAKSPCGFKCIPMHTVSDACSSC